MSSKYKVGENAIAHFVTFSVIGWIDVFSREQYKILFIDSFKYCQEKKGMVLHAWVIMTNHVHLIISSNTNKLEDIVRDVKKYTSKQIIKAIQENNTVVRHPKRHPVNIQASMTLPTRPDAPSQAHLQGTQSRHTKANLAKEPALCQRTAYPPQRTEFLSASTQYINK